MAILFSSIAAACRSCHFVFFRYTRRGEHTIEWYWFCFLVHSWKTYLISIIPSRDASRLDACVFFCRFLFYSRESCAFIYSCVFLMLNHMRTQIESNAGDCKQNQRRATNKTKREEEKKKKWNIKIATRDTDFLATRSVCVRWNGSKRTIKYKSKKYL